jgi:DNA helicase II / ATP-dependent DNA helicase PcrA
VINYEKELNQEQVRVVMEERGPLLVIAGAGSGKTRTLTYRVARLIEAGVPPERVLLATFTNKAARSMLSRVAQLSDVDTGRLWGGTFHHIANLTLRVHAPHIGYERNFSIMDSDDARQLISACITEKGIETKNDKFPRGNVIADIVSLAMNTETSIDEVIARRYPFFSHRAEEIIDVASHYRSRKKELNMMDFDDLLLNWRLLLRDFPDVLKLYAERFSHVLVDEYQDTNVIQAEIMDMLASRHRNIMVVGDDSQSIYSFRGANFANIIEFPRKYAECKTFKLETNYRSTPEILELANMSITYNEKQFPKVLRAVRERGIRPVIIPAKNVIQQANVAAERIVGLVREGVSFRDMAVLYRAHYQSMELQMELTRRGIPYELRSGIRFFEQAHIKDVTSYLRIVVNPFDELAWKRALGLCRNIGKATAEKIWRFVAGHENPLNVVLSDAFLRAAPKKAAPGLTKFQTTIMRLLDGADGLLSGLVDIVLDSGYREYLEEHYSDMGTREEDISQLADFSGRFTSLEHFLCELALMTNVGEAEEKDSAGHDGDDNKVVLSSIHQAKGLEWSVVMLIGCAEGMMPLARSLKEPEGEEEERRLFYVAVTRAKDQLYICYPLIDYSRSMDNMLLRPSRFIRELSSSSTVGELSLPYDQWAVTGEWE